MIYICKHCLFQKRTQINEYKLNEFIYIIFVSNQIRHLFDTIKDKGGTFSLRLILHYVIQNYDVALTIESYILLHLHPYCRFIKVFYD